MAKTGWWGSRGVRGVRGVRGFSDSIVSAAVSVINDGVGI